MILHTSKRVLMTVSILLPGVCSHYALFFNDKTKQGVTSGFFTFIGIAEIRNIYLGSQGGGEGVWWWLVGEYQHHLWSGDVFVRSVLPWNNIYSLCDVKNKSCIFVHREDVLCTYNTKPYITIAWEKINYYMTMTITYNLLISEFRE